MRTILLQDLVHFQNIIYLFDGWYENELCEGEAYNFTGKKMPAQNVTLYAKWTAKKINLTYNLNNPEGTVDKDTKKVEAGTVASTVLPSIPTINEYSFAGWYYADGNGNITSEVFNTNNTITRDTSIVGKWLYKGELRVVYKPGTETGATVPTDDKVYAGGAKVTVAGNATTTSNMKFLGWELNGNVYKPGQSFEVNKDIANENNQIILTATWGNAETSTTLTYNPGNGIGTATTVNVMNNEAVEIEAHDSLGFTTPVVEGKEYYFAGWADSSTGNATYADGQTINIDANGENVLYAVWVEKTEITLVANSGTRTYNGAEQSIEGFESTTMNGYTVSGLTAATKGTNVGEYPMNVQASDFTNNSNNFAKVTFVIEDGLLKITPKSIVPSETNGMEVTGPADTMYSGDEQKLTPVVKDQGKELTENVDYELSYTGDTTNVGTVKITIKGKGNYDGSTEVSYKITKRNVTLTSATDSKVYDKTPLTNHNVAVGGDGFVKEEGATYNVTGSQTSVGESDNEFTYTLKSNTKAENYNITTHNGKLIVTAEASDVTVVITGRNGTFPYDGTEKSVKGYDVSITQGSTYTEADFTFSGNDEVKGTEANTYPMGLKVSDFTNNNTNYSSVTFVVTDGSLVINPKSIIPDGPNTPDEKRTGIEATDPDDSIYDAKVHVNPLTVRDTKTNKDLVENKDYTLTYVGDVVNVGTVKVKVKGIGNYTGEFTKKYQITPREYTVTTDSAEKPYDGTALTAGGRVNNLVDGETVTLKITGSQTEVGSSNNTYSLTWDGSAKEKNYTHGTDSIGLLTVTPKSIIPSDTNGIEVTKPADSKYDGNVHENKPEVKDTKTGATLVEGTDYTLSYKGDTTNAGTVTVTITGAGNYTGSHNVEYQITKRNVTLTSATDSKVYDKTPLTNSNITIGGDGFAKLEGASYNVTGSQTNVGDSDNEFTYKLNDDTKASNYNIEVKFGKLYITTQDGQVIVVITGHKKTYDYDGTEKTVSGYDVSITEGSTYAETDFTFNGNAEVKATVANTYPMGLKASDFTNNNTNYSSVMFVVNDGSLVINPKSIIPDGPNTPDEKKTGIEVTNPEDSIYDGLPHVNPLTITDTKTKTDLEENKDYTLSYSKDVINVGTVEVNVKGIGNYTGEFTKTYKITPKEYTVTTESAKKVYDGTALTAGGKIEGIVSGETVEFTTTGSRTDEGTSKNTYSLKWNGSAIQTNYKLAKESIGDLTVTPKSIIPDEPDTPDDKKTGITVSNPKDSKYDGQEHREVLTVKDTKTGKDLIANKDYTVVYSDDLVNAGTVTIKVSGFGNYSGSFTKTYKITKRLVTLTSATVSKTYDGQALTNTSITVSGDGFVEGEGASYEVTGTQTSVGNSANAFEYKLNEKTLASNYDITKVVGTLTITAAPAPVTPPTSPTPVSPPPVTPRYIQQVVPAPTPQEEVKKEKTPKAEPKEEKVEKEKTPKARPEKFWALINLICAIVTVLFGLLLLISKRHKNKDDEDDETKDQTTTNEDEEKEQEKKRGVFTRVLAVLIAILSVVFFLVTEDMSLRWTWTDQWTIWMVVIGFVQIVVFFVGRKWKNVDDDEDEQAQQA